VVETETDAEREAKRPRIPAAASRLDTQTTSSRAATVTMERCFIAMGSLGDDRTRSWDRKVDRRRR
jgi:hypothetical protein